VRSRCRRGRLTPVDVVIAAGAIALVGWGLYRALLESVGS